MTSQELIFIRQFEEKWRFECKVFHHAHLELACSTVQCVERRTQHSALICTVNGRWIKLDYNIGVFNRCLYKHPVKDISVLRHGDDFATLAREELSKHLLVKHVATLGPRPQLLDPCEVRFLNRVIWWIVPPFGKAPERIEMEADPRHAELLIKNSSLQSNSKRVNI